MRTNQRKGRLRFGIRTNDPMTYVEIAKILDIGKTMVQALEQKASRKLRHIVNRNKMLDIKDTVDHINTPTH